MTSRNGQASPDTPLPAPLPQGERENYAAEMERLPRQEGTRRARDLRQRTTPHEALLWRHLRAGRMQGVKFKRQQPLGFYIADFVALEERLVIELDGSHHAGSEYDAVRDAELTARGFRVLRFWNNDVTDNLEGVLTRIAEALR